MFQKMENEQQTSKAAINGHIEKRKADSASWLEE